MKKILIDTLTKLARKNKQLYLLTGDLGYPHFNQFSKMFPKQYINMGVAEQNMIGVAAGLALSEKTVYVYSIVPFATMRCFEQIRNDICYHNLNVKIVAYGAGLTYSAHGATHFGLEDMAIMRALPNMAVLSPANLNEAKACIKIAYRHRGPVYIRMGKEQNDQIYYKKTIIGLGKGIVVKTGKDATIIATGNILNLACHAAKILLSKRLSVRVISMPSIKPIDKNIIIKAALETKIIFTIEEHSLIGGLGSAVSEVLIDDNTKNIRLVKLGLPDQYPKNVGTQEYMLDQAGLSVDKIVNKIVLFYSKALHL